MSFRSVVLASSVMFLASATTAYSADYTLRLAHYLPPTHNIAANILPGWAERIHEQSDGRIEIEIFPAGQLLGVTEIYDGVRAGVADIGWGMPGATPGRFPAISVFELPFIFEKSEHSSQVLMEMFDEGHMDDEFQGVEVLYLHTHHAGGIHTKTPVRQKEDLEGLRIRFPSMAVRMMLDRLGAEPVGVPAPQAYESLERGVLDGISFPFDALQGLRLGEQVNYHVDFPMYTLTFYLVMNERSLAQLPEDLQQVIHDNSGMDEAIAIGRSWDESELSGIEFVKGLGNEIIQLSAEEEQRWIDTVMPGVEAFLEETEEEGVPAFEMYERAQNRAAELAEMD